MKLIIDIDKELYEAYKGRPPRLGDEGMDMIAQAVANGIPITDVDLISRSVLKMYARCGIRAEDCIGDCDKCSDYCVAVNDIDNAPTIGDTENEIDN